MIVFEDKSSDLLSLLFKQSYNKEVSDKFIYSGGNGNIYKKAVNCLSTTSDRVFVFLDTVPENKSIFDIYRSLLLLSREYPKRLFVINIVCAEYYFIKSISNSNLITSKDGLDIILNRMPFHTSSLISTDKDRSFAKNFEKFCKLFLMKNVKDCAKHSRGSVEENNINELYGDYYTKDCSCFPECNKISITDKSISLLSEYPCIPSDSNIKDVVLLDDERIISLHRSLVDDYNKMAILYNESGTAKKSKLLRYMY